MRTHLRVGAVIAALLLSCFGTLIAAVPDRNVNMVSGTSWPGGDPHLQRQNEPGGAASTINHVKLLVGVNDYRTVDMQGLDGIKVIGDAWAGVFRSYDGGNTWTSTLLPGYPQDGSPEGIASPLKGYQAAADPVVRAGAGGIFYYSGIVLNRDENPLGALYVARYMDFNDKESSNLVEESAHSIRYVDTKILQEGTAGQFFDKPWSAVDIPRPGSAPCIVGGKRIDGGNVYIAYTILVGGDINIRSKMMVQRSTDCGATWGNATKLSESQAINQGSSIAIDPSNGNVYVTWRRITNGTETNAILFSKSTDFGQTFSKAQVILSITPFEQGTTALSFRTTAFPSMAVDGNGRIYITWSERSANGDGRIALINSGDGVNWSAPSFVVNHAERGHEFMPTILFSDGKLTLAWYDQREDHTTGIYTPIVENGKLTGQYTENRRLEGHRKLGLPGHVFNQFIQEIVPPSTALLRRHTLDTFVAQAEPGVMPVFISTRASQYQFGSRREPGNTLIEQMQFNPPNLPLFLQGTRPFFSDYMDLAAAPSMTQDDGGPWRFSTAAKKASVRHFFFTDNRDVRPPLDGNWRNYTPVASTGNSSSIFDPATMAPKCIPGQTGMRNQNVYTTRITEGLFAGSPGNTKPFLTPAGQPLQRAFVVFVQNALKEARTYRLTIMNQPVGGKASFLQLPEPGHPDPLVTLDVTIPARSSIARSVFATSTQKYDRIDVHVQEVSAPEGSVVPDGLETTVVLNPDIANPDIANPDIANPDIANPDIANAEVYNPDIANPDIANPDIANPDIANPDIANPDIANPDIANPDIANPDIANPDIANPDIANPDIANPDIANGSMSDTNWETEHQGNTAASFSINLLLDGQVPDGFKTQLILHRIYTTPIANACSLELERHTVLAANINSPEFTDPQDLFTSDVTDPSDKNATIWMLPGEKMQITLRVVDPDRFDNITFNAAEQVTPISIAHAINTEDLTDENPRPSVSLTILTSRIPDPIVGYEYSTGLAAIGGKGTHHWSVGENPLPAGLFITDDGRVAGTPTAAGDTLFTAVVADSSSLDNPNTDERNIRARVVGELLIPAQDLPDATNGQDYLRTIARTGGVAPFMWTFVSGFLPDGLTLSQDGVLSGNVDDSGTFDFTVQVTDGTWPNAQVATQDLSIQVNVVNNSLFVIFLNQPASRVEGTNPGNIDVRVQDATGARLPGVNVTLDLNPNQCNTAMTQQTALTNEVGEVRFLPPGLDSCSTYTYRATAQAVRFTQATTDSEAFDVFGFGEGFFPDSLGLRRVAHTATWVPTGRIVIVGGQDPDPAVGMYLSADLYDPATRAFESRPTNNSTIHLDGTATRMNDGTVLIAGGHYVGVDGEISSTSHLAERYDPTSNSFSTVNPMNLPRTQHSATLLPDGTVLVVGGLNVPAGPTNSIELFDGTGFVTWSATLSQGRYRHTATLVGNYVVIAGGLNTDNLPTSSIEIIDWAGQSIQSNANLQIPRARHGATRLGDGGILFTGGQSSGAISSGTEFFDINTMSSTQGPSMGSARADHIADLLLDGTVLVAGGTESDPPELSFASSVEILDPSSVELFFESFGNLTAPRRRMAGVPIPQPAALGRLAAVHGEQLGDGGPAAVSKVELFYPRPLSLAIVGQQLPDAILNVPYFASLHAVGGQGLRSWALTDGSLPQGLTLSSDGTIRGTPIATETSTFTAQVTDSGVPPSSLSAGYSIRVVGQLVIPAQTLPNATVGVPYSANVVATGGATPYTWFLISEFLPPGISFSADGVLSGTCTSPGSYLIGLRVRDTTNPRPQSTTASLPFQCDPGVLSFVSQPRFGAVVGEVIAEDLVVRAEDTNGNPLEGVFVTLTLNTSCNYGYEGPTVATDVAGDAHFLDVSFSRGCYDNTIGATASGFAPAVSDEFDVFGFGDARFGMDRVGHSATLLADGKILVAGGADFGGGFPLSAVLYDPVARSSRFATGNMVEARMFHTATLLPSGKVLIAGGHRGSPQTISAFVSTAELYDPVTETFTAVGPLINSRTFHTATLYTDGTVFLVGGRGIDGAIPAVEIYHPTGPDPFTAGPFLLFARANHTATLVGSRIVIIGGGFGPGDQTGISDIEIIDSPTTRIPGGRLTIPRTNHTATLLLSGGTILVAGGFSNATVEDRMEQYIVSDGVSIELAPRLSPPAANHIAVLVDGHVVIAGHSDDRGTYGSAVQLVRNGVTAVEPYGSLLVARSKMRAVELSNQFVIIGGERDGIATNVVETFFPFRD